MLRKVACDQATLQRSPSRAINGYLLAGDTHWTMPLGPQSEDPTGKCGAVRVLVLQMQVPMDDLPPPCLALRAQHGHWVLPTERPLYKV
jgi:hypothetical protein